MTYEASGPDPREQREADRGDDRAEPHRQARADALRERPAHDDSSSITIVIGIRAEPACMGE